MKKHTKFFAVMAAAVMVLGLGAHRADASGVNFSIGLNLGVPVIAAPVYAPVPVYAPAPVYVPQPARAYQVEKIRCADGYGYGTGAYRYRQAYHEYREARYRNDRNWHRGMDKDQRGWERNSHGQWAR